VTPENCSIFLAHAQAECPRETCGVLIIERGVESLVICRNVSDYDDQFVIDPIDYLSASKRGDVVAIVHSHCFVSPAPSQADRVACESSRVPWHIVSVPNGHWHTFEPNGYVAPLVGREWAHGSLDCYGLVRDYYKQTLGVLLPDFHRSREWWDKGENLYCLDNIISAGFTELVGLEDVREHDVLLMQVHSKVINHAGVYLGDDRFLHHLNQRLSSRDLWGGYWRKHTVKIARYR
jgi:proteasome lid subunit RPN8/RPN11